LKRNSFKTKKIGRIFEVLLPMVTYDILRANIGASLANDYMKENDESGEIVGIVRVGVSLERANKEVDKISKSAIGLTVIVIVASILLSFFLIKVLLNPIKELALGTKKIASGDLSYRVPLTSSDELSDLAESFNSMAQDLKSYVDELNNEKEDLLELKIMLEQRGKELEETLDKVQNIQQELLRSEKFATIGRLAASVAHELRNPLASLKNISYYLSKMGNFEDVKSKKMLDMLSSDVSRANKIITDLLDYSRAKKLNKLEIWIDEFVDKAISNVVLGDNIEVARELERFKAVVDPDKMTQVLINLISNARDAMPDGGLIKISCARKEGTYEIKVSDNGIGMSQETASHIFDPLYTTKLKGIGLGLSIVKEIVDAHFGAITVDSTESKGTVFTIMLPLE
jgi:signal transduction histidine kinase